MIKTNRLHKRRFFIAISSTKLTKAINQTLTITVETFMQIRRQLMAFAKQLPKHLETLKVWVDELLESLRKMLVIDSKALLKNKEFLKHLEDLKYGKVARVYPKLLT